MGGLLGGYDVSCKSADTTTISDLATARRLLGDDKIIGVTVSNVEEMRAAVEGGADYLGIGTVFSTQT